MEARAVMNKAFDMFFTFDEDAKERLHTQKSFLFYFKEKVLKTRRNQHE